MSPPARHKPSPGQSEALRIGSCLELVRLMLSFLPAGRGGK